MVRQSQIQDFVDRLAREFSPRRVLLFGSHARGDFSGDSDVDLLIVMNTEKRGLQQALEIRQRIACSFPLDLLVKTPEEIDRRVSQHDLFLIGILQEGKTLYESSRS